MDTINKTLAQAYLDMYETKEVKTERKSWVPEAIADEDVADFMGAAAAAAKAGKKEFKFGDKTYKVTMKKDTVAAISDEATVCEECGKVHEGSCNEEVKEETVDEVKKAKGKPLSQKQIKRALQSVKAQPKDKVSLKKAPWDESLDESPEQPRAKGEKEFKKMHDDNIEISDEEKNDEENFKNIKKSADAIKK